MRVARAILSIFVLVAIVTGAPSIAHARAFDPSSAVIADDFVDADLCACLSVPAPAVAPVIRSFAIVALDSVAVRDAARIIAILTCAPKTSPPGR